MSELHPANVLLGPDGPVVIDWTNAVGGPAALDLAWTWVVMASFVPEEGEVAGPLGRVTGRVAPWFIGRFVDDVLAAAVGRDAARSHLAEAAERRLADPGCRPAEAHPCPRPGRRAGLIRSAPATGGRRVTRKVPGGRAVW